MITVKVVVMRHPPYETQVQEGTTVQQIRETDVLGLKETVGTGIRIDNLTIIVNTMEVPSNTELKDGDIIVLTRMSMRNKELWQYSYFGESDQFLVFFADDPKKPEEGDVPCSDAYYKFLGEITDAQIATFKQFNLITKDHTQ